MHKVPDLRERSAPRGRVTNESCACNGGRFLGRTTLERWAEQEWAPRLQEPPKGSPAWPLAAQGGTHMDPRCPAPAKPRTKTQRRPLKWLTKRAPLPPESLWYCCHGSSDARLLWRWRSTGSSPGGARGHMVSPHGGLRAMARGPWSSTQVRYSPTAAGPRATCQYKLLR